MRSVEATAYGNPVTTPPRTGPPARWRPVTAWPGASPTSRASASWSPSTSLSTDHLTLLHRRPGRTRPVDDDIRLRFGGGDARDVALDDSSRAPRQRIDISARTFTTPG